MICEKCKKEIEEVRDEREEHYEAYKKWRCAQKEDWLTFRDTWDYFDKHPIPKEGK